MQRRHKEREGIQQQGYTLQKYPSMIITMISAPFIKYQNAVVKNSMALLPSEILTRVRQKKFQDSVSNTDGTAWGAHELTESNVVSLGRVWVNFLP